MLLDFTISVQMVALSSLLRLGRVIPQHVPAERA